MADSSVAITEGSGTDIDTRTEADSGQHRQVIIIGDPSTTAGVAPVDGTAGLKVDLGADNDVTVSGTITATPSGVQEIEGDEAEGSGSLPNPILIGGDDGTDITNIGVNTSGEVQVDIADSAVDLMLGTDFSDVLGTSSLITATQADGLANTTDTINVSAFVYGFDGTVWDRVASVDNGGGNALKVSVSSSDGTGIQNTANNSDNVGGLSTLAVTAFGMMWDGAAWDRARGDATNGLTVNLGANNDVTIDNSSIVHAEDSAHTSTDDGIMPLAVRNDTLAALAGTDGDYAPLQVNASGALYIQEGSALDVSAATVTVSGTVTANLSATDNTVLDNIDTSLNNIEAGFAADGSAYGSGVLIQGDDGTDRTALKVDTSGRLDVSAISSTTDDSAFTAGSTQVFPVSGFFNDSTPDSVDEGDQGIFRMSARREMYTQIRDAAGNERGLNVDANGDIGITNSNLSTIAGAVSGTEMQVDVVAELPAGTNTIGKVAPNEYELAGNTTHVKKYYTNSGAVTDGIVWSPAAGKRWYVTDIFINVSAASTVTLEDDLTAGDSPVWKAELAANSGWSHSFNTPLYSGEDASDLLITTTAGNVYVTVTGYEI